LVLLLGVVGVEGVLPSVVVAVVVAVVLEGVLPGVVVAGGVEDVLSVIVVTVVVVVAHAAKRPIKAIAMNALTNDTRLTCLIEFLYPFFYRKDVSSQ
jgi:hypothetical protein